MPIRRQLKLMRHIQHACLVEIITDNLHAYVLAVFVDATRVTHRGLACQIGANGEDVVQIHFYGIVALAAELKGGFWRRWAHDNVAHFVGAFEVFCDQATQLTRLQIVGIVIAVRQHIRSDQNTSLYLCSKTLGARAFVHIHEVGVFGGAVTITHAVKARQIA